MKIIVINGSGGAGKDTFIKYCREANHEIYSFSTVDYVKDIATLIGWNGKKDMRGRRFLSDLKDALSEYNDTPFKRCVEEIQEVMDDYFRLNKNTKNLIFFVHSREPKEIQRWKDLYNAQALLIRRVQSEKQEFTNHADLEVTNFDYDYVYWNEHELEDVRFDARSWMEWLMLQPWESKIE